MKISVPTGICSDHPGAMTGAQGTTRADDNVRPAAETRMETVPGTVAQTDRQTDGQTNERSHCVNQRTRPNSKKTRSLQFIIYWDLTTCWLLRLYNSNDRSGL